MKLFYGWMIVAVLVAGSAVSAQTSLSGSLDASGDFLDLAGNPLLLGPNPSGPLSDTISDTNALASAEFDYTYSEFDAATSGVGNQTLLTNSNVFDSLVFSAPGTTLGQYGYAAINFTVTGSVDINTTDGTANANNYAGWVLTHNTALGFYGAASYQTGATTDIGPSGDSFGSFTTDPILIQYGVPMPLIISTAGEYKIVSQGTIASSVSATDLRIEWGGVSLYTPVAPIDPEDIPLDPPSIGDLTRIEDGTITGASGTAYPVPEPTAVGAIGLLLASLASRRRRPVA